MFGDTETLPDGRKVMPFSLYRYTEVMSGVALAKGVLETNPADHAMLTDADIDAIRVIEDADFGEEGMRVSVIEKAVRAMERLLQDIEKNPEGLDDLRLRAEEVGLREALQQWIKAFPESKADRIESVQNVSHLAADLQQRLFQGGQAMLTERTVNVLKEVAPQALADVSSGLFTSEQVNALNIVVDAGQEHTAALAWQAAGDDTAKKQAYLDQVALRDRTYPTGLKGYAETHRQKLADKKAGKNPYAGMRLRLPAKVDNSQLDDKYWQAMDRGIEEADGLVIMLAQGGVGARLGWQSERNIKTDLMIDPVLEITYMEYFIRDILALQDAVNENRKERGLSPSVKIPYVHMVSGQTEAGLRRYFDEHNNFGMDGVSFIDVSAGERAVYDSASGKIVIRTSSGQTRELGQLILFRQEDVFVSDNWDGKWVMNFPLTEEEKKKAREEGKTIESRTHLIKELGHNHGDLNLLMHMSGLALAFADAGKKHIMYHQDTNAETFRAAVPGLGNMVMHDKKLNIISVPINLGENAGSVVFMFNPATKKGYVRNVEYSDIHQVLGDPEVRADMELQGLAPEQFNDGNINIFIMDLETYAGVLEKNHGLVGEEIVNRKADGISRLEAMVQDVYIDFNPEDVMVNSFDARFVFSAAKNSIANAIVAVSEGLFPENSTTAVAHYWRNRRILLSESTDAEINVDAGEALAFQGDYKVQTWRKRGEKKFFVSGWEKGSFQNDGTWTLVKQVFVEGIPYPTGARLSWTPDWARTADEVREKWQGGRIDDEATVGIHGKNIFFRNVRVEGSSTLIVKTNPDQTLVIEDLVVDNEGWAYRMLTKEDALSENNQLSEFQRTMWGFHIVKLDQKVIDLTGLPAGEYRVDSSGEVVSAIDTAMLTAEDIDAINAIENADFDSEEGIRVSVIERAVRTMGRLLKDVEQNPEGLDDLRRRAEGAGLRESLQQWIKAFPESKAGRIESVQNVSHLAVDLQQRLFQGDEAMLTVDYSVLDQQDAQVLQGAEQTIADILKTGFERGDFTEGIYKNSLKNTYRNLSVWTTDKDIHRLSPGLREANLKAIREGRWDDIIEAYRGEVPFGTAGIRGFATLTQVELLLLKQHGPSAAILKGPNTINDVTLLKKTQAVIDMMKEKGQKKVIIGYDSRVAGQQFAEMLARQFIAASRPDYMFEIYLFDEASPFPELSFGVREVGADWGLFISASHNPRRYNGFKITRGNGAQLNQKAKEEVLAADSKVKLSDIQVAESLADAKEKQLIWLGGDQRLEGKDYHGFPLFDMHSRHIAQVKKFLLDLELIENQGKNVKIGFAAYNGAGYKAVPRLLGETGFMSFKAVTKLQKMDGMFPAFNPEEQPDPGDPIAGDVAVREFVDEYGQEAFDELDAVIGTDPDADRMGFTAKIPEAQQKYLGAYRLLPANDAWTLLIWYRLMKKAELGQLDPEKSRVLFSHVTTDALEQVAALFGVKPAGDMMDKTGTEARGGYLNDRRTWVGFTYLGDWFEMLEAQGLYAEAGAEESNGFSIGGHVLDKDGTFAAILMAEVLAYAKEHETTVVELLDDIYRQIGFYATANKPLPRVGSFKGAAGVSEKIRMVQKAEQWMKEGNERAATDNPLKIAGREVIGVVSFGSNRVDHLHYENIPDEGIRFFFRDDVNAPKGADFTKSRNYITLRISGTSQTIRAYTQLWTEFKVEGEEAGKLKAQMYADAEAISLLAQAQLIKAVSLQDKHLAPVIEQLETLNEMMTSVGLDIAMTSLEMAGEVELIADAAMLAQNERTVIIGTGSGDDRQFTLKRVDGSAVVFEDYDPMPVTILDADFLDPTRVNEDTVKAAIKEVLDPAMLTGNTLIAELSDADLSLAVKNRLAHIGVVTIGDIAVKSRSDIENAGLTDAEVSRVEDLLPRAGLEFSDRAGRAAMPGGIDLNPEFLNLKIKRDGSGIPLPLLDQPLIELINEIEGFLPVIINITPVMNLPMLLGLVDTDGSNETADGIPGHLDVMDKVAKLD